MWFEVANGTNTFHGWIRALTSLLLQTGPVYRPPQADGRLNLLPHPRNQPAGPGCRRGASVMQPLHANRCGQASGRPVSKRPPKPVAYIMLRDRAAHSRCFRTPKGAPALEMRMNAARIGSMDSWPNFLRWALLPIAVVATSAACEVLYVVLQVINGFMAGMGSCGLLAVAGEWFGKIVGGVLRGYLPCKVAIAIAPRGQVVAATVVATLIAILNAAAIAVPFFIQMSEGISYWIEATLLLVLGVAGSGAAIADASDEFGASRE